MSQVAFYQVQKPELQFLLRHYWSLTTRCETAPSLLLPTDHVDLILAPIETFDYYLEEKIINPQGIHFHGLRRKSMGVLAKQKVRVWGISFQPWGFHSIAETAMNAFTDKITMLQDIHPDLSRQLKAASANWDAGEGFRDELEQILASALNTADQEVGHMNLIRRFIEAEPESITSYCRQSGISLRHFQRLFNRYVGVGPKNYLKIKQFELSSRELLYDAESGPLTNVGIDSGYYDQSHFIRHFKSHTSFTPGKFQGKQPALKSKLFKRK